MTGPGFSARNKPQAQESEAEREARYFAGYLAYPDGEDEDFKAIDRFAVETLAKTEDESDQ
jgi:Zn-dependent peptidase ImmA (M78 family)